MSRRPRRTRPADPLVIAQRRAAERLAERNPESWGVDRAALALPANADVEAGAAGGGRRHTACRRDAFDRLLAAERGEALTAVRRLQADIAARHMRPGGVAPYAERVDAGPAEDPFADKRLRAGERLRQVLVHTGAASARLLVALVEPAAALGQVGDWRTVVERESGERLADAQAGALRAACLNLAAAYAAFDRGR
jgi:hypothetical protein